MEVSLLGLRPWKLFFDGSKTKQGVGAGVVLRSPEGTETQVAFRLDFPCSNNQAEYEALILGLGLLLGLKADTIEIIGDSQLVIKQLAGEYRCESEHLVDYFTQAKKLIEGFQDIVVRHVPRSRNQVAKWVSSSSVWHRSARGQYRENYHHQKVGTVHIL
ncbi:uncharacterized protein Mb2253c-like [Telopea speciosissima]|uniref:uncharacterized protein Mb2253c-like n=1 Tax=Telopea speciosissima TaxID=54955 RepID=UPI001CC7662B|nr:uncharacterized protein Mb2253c-like [Telopea speciosissima]